MAESQYVIDAELKKLGLAKVNEPKWTPSSTWGTKGVVLAQYIDRYTGRQTVKLIRFGTWGHPHNYSAEARTNWLMRNGRKMRKGRSQPEYWEYYYLWTPGADVMPIGDNSDRIGLMVKGGKV